MGTDSLNSDNVGNVYSIPDRRLSAIDFYAAGTMYQDRLANLW